MARQVALRLIKSASSPEMASGSDAALDLRTGHFVASAIWEYLLTKRQEGRSPETIKQYELRLGQFAKWLAGRDVMRLNDLSRLLLREWGVSLNPAWSPATTRNAITIVNGFLGWCSSEGLTPDERLTTALHVPKVKRRFQRALSADEVKKLLDACDFSMFGLRDAAIVSLMVDSGLRASELCRLKALDLIFNFPLHQKRVNFIPTIGKGGDQEPVYFGEATAARLKDWLNVRVAKPGTETLFVSLGGNTPLRALGRHGLYRVLKDLGNRAGVPGVTPHSLRRTFALLLDAGRRNHPANSGAWQMGRYSDGRALYPIYQNRQAVSIPNGQFITLHCLFWGLTRR